MRISCPCKNNYQDAKYGRNVRIGNLMRGSQSVLEVYKCTSCGGEVHTANRRGAKQKAGGGSGKNRFWFESATHLRDLFNKTRSIGLKL